MKQKSRATRLSDAVAQLENAKSELESLRDELDNWKSGMEGTNLENTNKYQMLEDAVDNLEQVISSLEDAIDNANSVEFPSMFS